MPGNGGFAIGVWVAHEGRLHFLTGIMREVIRKEMAPVRFVDDDENLRNISVESNGSPGITALFADGRHLALMPHPERIF
jgi:phosphoribosylformylglycinamidine synthase